MSDTRTDRRLRILVYSDDADVRTQVILALGRRPHPDFPEAEYVEVATEPVVLQQLDAGSLDLVILDGEAVPAGGLGIAKQLKDEIYQCPPILVLTGRPQDAWLATWSRADGAVPHPLDPLQLAETVTRLLRGLPAGPASAGRSQVDGPRSGPAQADSSRADRAQADRAQADTGAGG